MDLAQQWLDLAADIEAIEEGRIPSAQVHCVINTARLPNLFGKADRD
jgi:hypothetical protein